VSETVDAPAAPVVAPPTWRDPWAWAAVASVLVLFARCAGAHLGEPAAEDFDMLHRALFEPTHTWLDGGGTHAFWRPLSFQAYFAVFGRLMLRAPFLLGLVHAALLALAVALLYRTFRTRLSGPLAAAAASFPVLAESTRVLLAWPSQFGDLGALLFSAAALHEATRRRLPTALLALAAALLCKEVAVVTALLLPLAPALGAADAGAPPPLHRERVRWALATGLVTAAWASVYAWVRIHAGLELPHGIERDPAIVHTAWATRLGWAWWNSARATLGLGARPDPSDGLPLLVAGGLVAIAVVGFAMRAPARQRLAASRPWVLWGAAWFVLGAAALAPIYPLWAPVRSAFAAVGLGVAAVLFLRAAHPALARAFVALRLLLVLLAVPAPTVITPEPVDRGEFVDFGRVARLQLQMHECRRVLQARFPRLAPGALVGFRNLPLATEYAFGGPRAIQAWYGDSTLRWITYPAFQAQPETAATALLDFQVKTRPPFALLTPAALATQMRAVRLLKAASWQPALAAFDSADVLQRDRTAVIFLGDNAGRRAYCLAQLGRFPEAEADSWRALAAAPGDVGARFVLAAALAVRKQRTAALAELDTLLSQSPGDSDAKDLRDGLLRAPADH